MNNKIVIEDYNPAWPQVFNELKLTIETAIPDLFLSIEHVGSTSVPGLSAKPIIDLDIVIEDSELLLLVSKNLEKLGYYHEGNLGIEDREAFARSDEFVPWIENKRVWMEHHLYVCIKESGELKRHLAFRNYLRENPKAIEDYGLLKRKLAASEKDRIAYTAGKGDFINSILRSILKD
ncbi:GrpB family protein [Planococcus sp. CAU13]|uniref:GrpB family protein n=1 Tax=Planococcus sp. CAU13 TaxID=1541197 RepID=UPI00052FF2A0|nr:GrpB family protein [Planococcus sp. CAU13]